jgi:DNA (cytosine-5)-methyltransferase 1
MTALTIGSLFSGIGGLELGLEWAGLGPTLWQVERDPSARHWLAEHWPDAIRHDDVCAVGAHNLTPVDLICGGFPCQPHSVAGKRQGSNDERDLWGEFGRVVRELRPSYVVGENVPGLLTSDGGRFFNRVLSDLAALGFDVEWDVLSAADVGAPHLRERLFIVATSRGVGQADARRSRHERERRRADAHGPARALEGEARERERRGPDAGNRSAGVGRMAHASGGGRREERALGGGSGGGSGAFGAGGDRPLFGGEALGHAHGERGRGRGERRDAGNADASGEVVGWREAVPVRGLDGTVRLVPADAAARGPESPLYPVAHGVSGRVARLRAVGNAVVPQVAEVVGRLIVERERQRAEEAA